MDTYIFNLYRSQNKYTSTVFINLKIFVDVDGTLSLINMVNNFVIE